MTLQKPMIGIVGAQGYAGRELARLLLHHPYAELAMVFSRDDSWALSDELAEIEARCVKSYPLSALMEHIAELDVVFLATPPSVSLQLTPSLLEAGVRVIDLSGAFRLSQEAFETWYHEEHSSPDLLASARYGLSPWWCRGGSLDEINLIANPGCYATGILLTLIPLLQENIIDSSNIIIDAKSGLSGAGRQIKSDLLFCEIDSNYYPYKIGCHQHSPEVSKYVESYTDKTVDFTMMTYLMPVKRGITITVYADLLPNASQEENHAVEEKIESLYANAFQDYSLVKFGLLNENDKKNQALVSLQRVVGSNRINIGFKIIKNKLILITVFDNLLKGAAGQAIENFNALYKFPLETGLLVQGGIL